MDSILIAIENIMSIETILICIIGTIVGIILGAIPGMNGGIGVAVLLPFTYTMDPAGALLFLGAIYMTSSYGGSIAGILMNIPGTVEAACTAIEGYALTKQGKGRQALYFAAIGSTIGGFVGVIALIFFTPILAELSVKFGPPEMFLVALCGLTIVGTLAGKSVSKGIFAALFGMFLGMIGINHVTGEVRFTFGIDALSGGIGLIPAVIGFFAIAEIVQQVTNKTKSKQSTELKLDNYKFKNVFKETMKDHKLLTAKSSVLGTLIGLLPGTGGAISSFLAYGEAKRSSKQKEKFGKGNPEGIIAAESGNNAAVGGAMVPMLSLGIPGSSTSAIMFGALMIHGLVPGPRLFSENGDITYTFLFGMLLTVVFMLIFSIVGIPFFSKFIKVKVKYIMPAVIIFSLIGAFSVQNSMYDVVIALACGFIGILFMKAGIPSAPIILGLILGELVESNLVRTLTIVEAQNVNFIQYVVTRPISIVILILTVYLIYVNYKAIKKEKQMQNELSN